MASRVSPKTNEYKEGQYRVAGGQPGAGMGDATSTIAAVDAKKELIPDFIFASKQGNVDLAQSCIKAKVDVNARRKGGRPAIFIAALKGHNTFVRFLLSIPGVNVNARDEFDYTPLMAAAEESREETVDLLLSAPGVDVNAQTKNGSTALSKAVKARNPKIVQMFIDNKADVNLSHQQAGTPLHLAAKLGDEEVVRLLLSAQGVDIDAQTNNRSTALSKAVKARNPKIVQMFIDSKADVNLSNDEKATPLHLAVELGDKKSVRRLLEAPGVRVNAKNIFDNTALEVAARLGDEEVVRLLIAAPGVRDVDTAVKLARESHHDGVVYILLEAGVGMDNCSQMATEGRAFSKPLPTLLSKIANDDRAAVQRFIDGNTDLNAKDEEGNTALYCAAVNNRLEITYALLQAGADKDPSDIKRAIAIAEQKKYKKMVELLNQTPEERAHRGP